MTSVKRTTIVLHSCNISTYANGLLSTYSQTSQGALQQLQVLIIYHAQAADAQNASGAGCKRELDLEGTDQCAEKNSGSQIGQPIMSLTEVGSRKEMISSN